MPNIFEEQARDRFRKSQAFMQKAQALLQDDLIYRSALADAVSAIKNMLQGYLLLKVARTPTSANTQQWQEIAASNRMPDLIQACGEAGLDLRGVAVEVKRLNNERNYRTHDDPQRLVDPEQAQRAMELSLDVQRRIRNSLQGRSDDSAQPARAGRSGALATAGRAAAALASRAAPTQAERPHAAPASPTTSTNAAPPTATAEPPANPSGTTGASTDTPPPSAQPTDATNSASPNDASAPSTQEVEGDDDPLAPVTVDDTRAMPTLQRRRRAGPGQALVRILLAAALLLVGVIAGAGVMYPVASGHTPAWLAFTSRFLPATPAPTATPQPTAPPTPTTQVTTLGALEISPPLCQSSATTLTLRNTGPATLTWAIASPDAATVTFSSSESARPAPSQFGALTTGSAITITASGATRDYHLTIIAPAGAAQLLAAAC